jgi:hypothetical protein
MYRIFLIFGWLIATLFSCNTPETYIDLDLLDKNEIYLVYRGTNTKEGIISKEFTLKNKNASHVGIAIFNKEKWSVYHILNNRNAKSDLINEDFSTFYNIENENIKYSSIWKINNLDSIDKEKIRLQLKIMESLILTFDTAFSIENGKENFYCSEFIVFVLENANNKNFKFDLHKVKLKSIYKSILRKDSLVYYPVDLFQFNKNFSLIEERYF